MEYVSFSLYTWSFGFLVAIVLLIIRYGAVKAIKDLKDELDYHKKEFSDEVTKNMQEHNDILRVSSKKANRIKNDITRIETKLDFIIEKIKN